MISDAIEAVAQGFEPPGLLLPCLRLAFLSLGPGVTELSHHVGLARLVRVQLQAKAAKTDILQAPVDDLQRGRLLRNEEDSFALAHQVGDQIADGLTLSGAGRAD